MVKFLDLTLCCLDSLDLIKEESLSSVRKEKTILSLDEKEFNNKVNVIFNKKNGDNNLAYYVEKFVSSHKRSLLSKGLQSSEEIRLLGLIVLALLKQAVKNQDKEIMAYLLSKKETKMREIFNVTEKYLK